MPTFLICQATYTNIECALYSIKKDICSITAQCSVEKKMACAQLVDTLQQMLTKQQCTWNDLTFIGINQGPAPFTTLRVLIATINGIAYATQVPLVGVDGLQTFFTALQNPTAVILLNAFNNDVYYAYQDKQDIYTGCAPLADVLQKLAHTQKKYIFAGTAVRMHATIIKNTLGDNAQWLEEPQEYTPLQATALTCLQKFNAGHTEAQLQPLYLKSPL